MRQQLKFSPKKWNDKDVLDCDLFKNVFKIGKPQHSSEEDVRAQTYKRKLAIESLHDCPRDVSLLIRQYDGTKNL